MGIDVDLWRARVGVFGRYRCLQRSSHTSEIASFLPGCLIVALHFLCILTLLVIGNVELNPGPLLDKCQLCGFESALVSQLVKHQQIHADSSNFRYVCPVTLCHSVFLNYANLCTHVSNHRLPKNNEAILPMDNAEQPSSMKCSICGKIESCVKNWCDHFLKQHLKSGLETVRCPLVSACDSTRSFKTGLQLRPHLSQFHPGWAQNFGRCVSYG